MRPLIGIDVGWSLSRRTCALATAGGLRPSSHELDDGITVTLHTLDELLHCLSALASRQPQEMSRAMLVIDGAVAPDCRLPVARYVDAAFAKGGFRLRAPCYPLGHGSGRLLAEVTTRILVSLKGAGLPVYAWLGGDLPDDRLVVAETNPTAAMAVLGPQQPVALLPSRKRHVEVGGRRIRAKSDWYWHSYGRSYCIDTLGPSIGAENHHERVAAVFCLALASRLAGSHASSLGVVAAGSCAGVFVIPREIDISWRPDVERIGIVCGVPAYSHWVDVAAPERRQQAGYSPAIPSPAQSATGVVHVVLNDNGGLNVRSNPWLTDIAVPRRVQACDSGVTMTVQAPFAGRSDMFRVSPSTLSVARRLSFSGSHLSTSDGVRFDALLIPDAD